MQVIGWPKLGFSMFHISPPFSLPLAAKKMADTHGEGTNSTHSTGRECSTKPVNPVCPANTATPNTSGILRMLVLEAKHLMAIFYQIFP